MWDNKKILEDFSVVLKPGTFFVDHYISDHVEIYSNALLWINSHDYTLEQRESFASFIMDQCIE